MTGDIILTKQKYTAPIYFCPFCDVKYRGPIGKRHLIIHVEKDHQDKIEEFKEMPIEEYQQLSTDESPILEIQQHTEEQSIPKEPIKKYEPILTQQEPVYQEQPPYQPSHKLSLYDEIPEPDVWLENFLKEYNCTPRFIQIQLQMLRSRKELPYSRDLETDLKQMTSGYKAQREISFVGEDYENRVRDYLEKRKKQDEFIHRRRSGYSIDSNDDFNSLHHKGYSIEGQSLSYPQPSVHRNEYFNELRELKAELKNIESERRRQQDEEIKSLKAKLEDQTYHRENKSPEIEKLEQKLDLMEKENRKLIEEFQRQREQTLQKEIQEVKTMALNKLSPDQIQQLIDKAVNLEHDRVTAKDVIQTIDQRIENVLKGKQGLTEADVEMEKARNQYEIENKKLEVEQQKGEQWGETLKDIAGIASDGFGKGIASIMNKQKQEGMTNEVEHTVRKINCPNCNTPIGLPYDVEFGVCASCQQRIVIDENGNPKKYIEPNSASFIVDPIETITEPIIIEPEQSLTESITMEEQSGQIPDIPQEPQPKKEHVKAKKRKK